MVAHRAAAGKSTLLRCIAGLHRISTGRIHLGPATTNGPVQTIRPATRADPPLEPDQAFYLPQETPPASSLRVFEAVLPARAQATRRRGAAARAAERDTAQALTALNLNDLATDQSPRCQAANASS